MAKTTTELAKAALVLGFVVVLTCNRISITSAQNDAAQNDTSENGTASRLSEHEWNTLSQNVWQQQQGAGGHHHQQQSDGSSNAGCNACANQQGAPPVSGPIEPPGSGGHGYPPQGGIDPPGSGGHGHPPQGGGGHGCVCVPYYQCKNNTIVTDGAGLIDIRIRPEQQCPDYLEVCCKPPDVADKPIHPTAPPLRKSGCGIRNQDGLGFRITGAEDGEAQYGEFPWMTAILKMDRSKDGKVLNVYQCGGSLIHPQVVLTAAHCVDGKDVNSLKVRMGEWDTQTQNELYPYQDRLVLRKIIHEDFYAASLFNDVALLFLDRPIDPAPNVDTICLPEADSNYDGVRCFASGWGKDSYGKEGRYQVILKKIDLPIVPRPQCQEALRHTRLGPYFKLHKSFICAGGEPGKDTCKGDGGSPLVCPLANEPERFVQVGIVAWGIECGKGDIPGVYANVIKLSNWIDHHLQEGEYEHKHYRYPGWRSVTVEEEPDEEDAETAEAS